MREEKGGEGEGELKGEEKSSEGGGGEGGQLPAVAERVDRAWVAARANANMLSSR